LPYFLGFFLRIVSATSCLCLEIPAPDGGKKGEDMTKLFKATIKNVPYGKLIDGRGLFIIKTGETGS
jgi:hypothetical protein